MKHRDVIVGRIISARNVNLDTFFPEKRLQVAEVRDVVGVERRPRRVDVHGQGQVSTLKNLFSMLLVTTVSTLIRKSFRLSVFFQFNLLKI